MTDHVLHTSRLSLRQWRESDREPFAALSGDPEVMRYFPSVLSRAESDALVDRCMAAIDERGWGLWAVERDGEFLGFTGLAIPTFEADFLPTGEEKAIEVGWRFSRSAWGHGFATEAATAALDFAFDSLGREEVLSFTATVNVRSQRVMERLGMSRDIHADFDHPRVPEGSELRRHVLYRLSGLEWKLGRGA